MLAGTAGRTLEGDVTGGQWLIALLAAAIIAAGLTAAIGLWLLGA